MIYGERTVLRPWLDTDMPYILDWGADREVQRWADGDYPRTLEAVDAWLAQLRRNRHKRYFIILDENGVPIGDTELDFIAWRSGEAELRIRIGRRDLWGKGYGTDSILALLHHAFFQMGLRRIYLRVLENNYRAIRCYQKCGFKAEGELVRPGADGIARRIVLMRILKEEFIARARRLQSRRAATG